MLNFLRRGCWRVTAEVRGSPTVCCTCEGPGWENLWELCPGEGTQNMQLLSKDAVLAWPGDRIPVAIFTWKPAFQRPSAYIIPSFPPKPLLPRHTHTHNRWLPVPPLHSRGSLPACQATSYQYSLAKQQNSLLPCGMNYAFSNKGMNPLWGDLGKVLPSTFVLPG